MKIEFRPDGPRVDNVRIDGPVMVYMCVGNPHPVAEYVREDGCRISSPCSLVAWAGEPERATAAPPQETASAPPTDPRRR